MNDVLSGGEEDGTCSENAWHAGNLLGEPNFYPGYADTKLGFIFSSENSGHEFIELEYPYPVYISGFELYEVFKPGALWRISTTDDYVDDAERPCTGDDMPDAAGVPKCETKTEWRTLWTRPRETVALKGESANIMDPPLCPSLIKTRIVRLDFDISRAPGWNNFDAAKLLGSLDAPPGLLSDPSNRFVYVPLDGVHGTDRLKFAVTDCLNESEESEYNITVSTPEGGVFSPSAFSEVTAVLVNTTPGTIVEYALDLTSVLQKIKATTGGDPMTIGRVWHTTSIGAEVGKTFAGISLSNATIDISVGTETMVPSKVEMWLEDVSGLTFRVLIAVKIECENGTVDQYRGICVCNSLRWTGWDCTVEVSEDRNEITPAIKGSGYTMFAVNVLIILACFFGVVKNKDKKPVRAAQPFFLQLLLLGAFICNSTIVAMQIEESDAACALRPWLWSLGFSIMFGSLFAKVLRIFKVFKYGRAMRRKHVTVKDTLWPVIVILAMNAIILICWTAIDPLQWVRTVKMKDRYGDTLSSYGQCASNHINPYLASIATLNGCLMVVACFMSYKAKHLPSEFHESQHISLAVMSCIQVYFIGVPVLIIVGSDPSISAFTQSAIIFLTTCAVLLLIFWPILSSVYKGNDNQTTGSNHSASWNEQGSSASRPFSGSVFVSGLNARQGPVVSGLDSRGRSSVDSNSSNPVTSVAAPTNYTAEHDTSLCVENLNSEGEMFVTDDVEEGNDCKPKEKRRVSFEDDIN